MDEGFAGCSPCTWHLVGRCGQHQNNTPPHFSQKDTTTEGLLNMPLEEHNILIVHALSKYATCT